MDRTIELINTGNGINYAIRSKYNEETNNMIKGANVGATWDPDLRAWLVPESDASKALIQRLENYYGFETI